MSLADELAALAQAMTVVPDSFEAALAAKAQTAASADDSKKLADRLPAQITADLSAPLSVHVGNHLSHGLDKTKLATMLASEVDAALANRPLQNKLPITRYGSLSYLPAGVSGSFEGATTSIAVRETAMCLEDDGTLTYLRNGLNGSKLGVYYAYMKDAAGPGLTQSTKTNRRYQPAYFPLGSTAAWIQSCSESVIFGRLQDSNGALGDWFLSLTNGTFDDSVHTGCFISNAQYVSLGMSRGECFVAGNTVYLLCTSFDNNGVLEFDVFTLSKASVAAGGTLIPTRQTGFMTTGFNGTVYNNASIRLCNKMHSTSTSDSPMIHNPESRLCIPMHFEYPSLVSAVDANGNIRTKVSGGTYVPSSQASFFGFLSFSFTWNITGKVCKLDDIYLASQAKVGGVTPGNGASNTVFTGAIWTTDVVTEALQTWANSLTKQLYSGKWLFAFRVNQVTDSMDITRSEFSSVVSDKFAALLRGNVTGIARLFLTMQPSYGSAIGGLLMGPYALSDTKVVCNTLGKLANGNTGSGLAYSLLEGAPTANYRSLQNGALVGYKPSASREFLIENTPTMDLNKWYSPVTQASASGTLSQGQHFIEGQRLSCARNLNTNFTTSGVMNVSAGVLAAAKAAALALVSFPAAVTDSFAQLVVPNGGNGCPPFLIISYLMGSTGYMGTFIAPCTVTLSGDDITAITPTSASPRVDVSAGGVGLNRSAFYTQTAGAVVIYDNGTSFLVGCPAVVGYLTVGNAPNAAFRFRYNKASGTWVWPTNLGVTAFNMQVNGRNYYASSTLGFGLVINSDAYADYGTKLPFMPITKNSDSEFDSYSSSPAVSTWKVLTSQDVAATWMLYFTEPTPLLVHGKFYTVPTQSVDLTTIQANPASTTFYVYVLANAANGTASYLVSTTVLTENTNQIYLGYIQTGTSSIDTVAIEKVTKILRYRLSAVSRGSAIAVTTGPVPNPATLQWS